MTSDAQIPAAPDPDPDPARQQAGRAPGATITSAAAAPAAPAAAPPAAAPPAPTPPAAGPPAAAPALGPALGLAQRELNRRLASVLAETGTPALTWYAFQRLAVFGSAPTAADFRSDLTDALDLDSPAAAALLDELLAAGLMHEVGTPSGGSPSGGSPSGGSPSGGTMSGGEARIGLTAAGQALQARIRGPLAAGTAELVAPFDPADIDTTIRTLTALAERARALRGGAR